jgi:hypothetical protein
VDRSVSQCFQHQLRWFALVARGDQRQRNSPDRRRPSRQWNQAAEDVPNHLGGLPAVRRLEAQDAVEVDAAVDELVRQLRARRPDLHIFLDRLELNPGAAWQQHIFDSLDDSRKVICAYSPEYLASKVCQEEFNMALLRHRESEEGVLLPLYLFSAKLPSCMRILQYEDAREADNAKIALAADRLLSQIG